MVRGPAQWWWLQAEGGGTSSDSAATVVLLLRHRTEQDLIARGGGHLVEIAYDEAATLCHTLESGRPLTAAERHRVYLQILTEVAELVQDDPDLPPLGCS
ncbi:hypothetical protein [Pseudonocardia sp. WMMC193]|uniref:hypothetical protein n=1 Tax=Pseudonocardia sp. WMMC193 TaxID=2911965 RepID=UPI001F23C380|nr:hypothetical protein [Pseudonocardia sp. WMMC193]MCF7552645.1 hypothetical protein [Pseudonocardia sp. WMMC193]